MTTTSRRQDRYGLALSTSSHAAAERYIEGIDRLLSRNAGAGDSLEAAIAADEGFALAHAALATLLQAQGRLGEAQVRAARARALAAGQPRREWQHVEAIAAAVSPGEPGRATALMREHLAEFPRDALILNQLNFQISFSGRQDRQQERMALLDELAPAYGDDWWFLSTHGFSFHELDCFEQSRALSERSLAAYPRNAGATHNLGHVYYETCDHAAGTAFFEGWLPAYAPAAPYHSHLSWHLALFELSAGRYGRVMELYERAMSPAVAQTRLAFLDAASLLWRWQVYGCGGGPLEWTSVCALGARVAPPGMAFADAHLALAYAAAGDDAALSRLYDRLRELDARGHPIAGSITLPLAQGIAAFARGEYDEAVRQIEPLLEQLVRVGGSNAQREVFEDTLIEACLRGGLYDRAETLLRRRLGRRPSARDFFWLGRAQAATGSPEAAMSLQEVRSRWPAAQPDTPEQAALARAIAAAGEM